MPAEPTFDTKPASLPRTVGPQAVAQFADIIAPDETRDVRAPQRRTGRQAVPQIVVTPLCEGGTILRRGVGDLMMLTPIGLTAIYLSTLGSGSRGILGSCIFEAEQTGSTYEPLPDKRIIAGFRRMLEARRVSIGDHHYHALHRQLVALLSDEDELAESSMRPSMVSFAGILEFLRQNNNLKHPGLSLNGSGCFVAAWQPRGRAKLSIVFNGLMDANWIASDRSGSEPARGSGAIARMSASAIDARFRVWMFA